MVNVGMKPVGNIPQSWLVLFISFSALTLFIGSEEGHAGHNKPVPRIPTGSVSEQVEEEDRWVLVDPDAPEKRH